MAARSMSTGTISFGLVTVPIRIYAASETSSAVSFNLLHDKCNSRLKQQYICPKDEELVTRDHMVKGYEFAKDQYVIFTEDEIKAMAEESTRTIEITEFVPISKVDPIYFEGAYYLGPDKGGEKAYKLLSDAMRQTGRCALAKWAARGKGYLVLLRPFDNGMVMQVLHYADEVRAFDEVPVGDAPVRDQELKLAVQLVEQISTDEFHPASYVDEVRARYHEAIQRKVEGKQVSVTPEAPKAQIIDLMEALKASLAQKGGARPVAVEKSEASSERKAPKRALAPEAAESRSMRVPKAAAGGKRR